MNPVRRKNYPQDNVNLPVEAVKKGSTIAEASRTFKVPESTIRVRKPGKYKSDRSGRSRVFTKTEEDEIVD